MKIIIAGGRDLEETPEKILRTAKAVFDFISTHWSGETPIEIVSGCDRGGDSIGEAVARRFGFELSEFPADWTKNGKIAGFIRNEAMACYADALIALPGGNGTRDMIRRAIRRNLIVVRITF